MCLPHVAWRSTSERALTAPRPDASPRWPKLRTVRVPEKAGAALSTRLVASGAAGAAEGPQSERGAAAIDPHGWLLEQRLGGFPKGAGHAVRAGAKAEAAGDERELFLWSVRS